MKMVCFFYHPIGFCVYTLNKAMFACMKYKQDKTEIWLNGYWKVTESHICVIQSPFQSFKLTFSSLNGRASFCNTERNALIYYQCSLFLSDVDWKSTKCLKKYQQINNPLPPRLGKFCSQWSQDLALYILIVTKNCAIALSPQKT